MSGGSLKIDLQPVGSVVKTSEIGAAVSDGVSGNEDGVQYYTIPMDLAAGTTYKYQCGIPSHAAMIGDLVIV